MRPAATGKAMEMHQVRYFLALCDTLNFTRAAERCNVAQPSLTRAIKLLEDEFGGPLFNRERNNTHLTELGRMMAPHLRELMEQARTARLRAQAFRELKTARLKLGLARGVALRVVDGTLQGFAASFPDTEIVLLDDHAESLRTALRQGDLEVVVLPQQISDVDDFHYYPVAEEGPQILVRTDHRLAAMAEVPIEELLDERILSRDQCQFFGAVERKLHDQGHVLRPRIIADATEWLAVLVEGGLGVAVTGPRFVTPAELVARPIAALPSDHRAALATKRGRQYSPPVRAFVDLALRPRRGPTPTS